MGGPIEFCVNMVISDVEMNGKQEWYATGEAPEAKISGVGIHEELLLAELRVVDRVEQVLEGDVKGRRLSYDQCSQRGETAHCPYKDGATEPTVTSKSRT